MTGYERRLRVRGECTTDGGETVRLRPPWPPHARPNVTGPVVALRAGDPPAFHVDSGTNPFYAIEITDEPSLFSTGEVGGHAAFYATWQHGPLLDRPDVKIPVDAWRRLRSAELLYYRIVTSSSLRAWRNVVASVRDQDSAPLMVLTDVPVPVDDPATVVLVRVVERSREASPGRRDVVAVRYEAHTESEYRTVTILPEGAVVEIEVVP